MATATGECNCAPAESSSSLSAVPVDPASNPLTAVRRAFVRSRLLGRIDPREGVAMRRQPFKLAIDALMETHAVEPTADHERVHLDVLTVPER